MRPTNKAVTPATKPSADASCWFTGGRSRSFEAGYLANAHNNRGMALVPLQVYFKNGVAKVQLGLGRGRKKGDERESIKRQEDLKEARAAMQRRKG